MVVMVATSDENATLNAVEDSYLNDTIKIRSAKIVSDSIFQRIRRRANDYGYANERARKTSTDDFDDTDRPTNRPLDGPAAAACDPQPPPSPFS
ncbi:unnamed protein product [Haemonchus placei]|uniref:Uncharacterized protein n=1 Tax=Haemonchus placei TaxID=6290 RepID=A0A0N4X164_HAEPC|nr:unnamed protein product [Haemonchus placei]